MPWLDGTHRPRDLATHCHGWEDESRGGNEGYKKRQRRTLRCNTAWWDDPKEHMNLGDPVANCVPSKLPILQRKTCQKQSLFFFFRYADGITPPAADLGMIRFCSIWKLASSKVPLGWRDGVRVGTWESVSRSGRPRGLSKVSEQDMGAT